MLKILALLLLSSFTSIAFAQAKASEGLKETLVTVKPTPDSSLSGVISVREISSSAPTKLVVLLPGHPSILNAVIENGKIVKSSLSGNFLVRARRQLIDDNIITVLVDCRIDKNIGTECPEDYMGSSARHDDIRLLTDEAKKQFPTLTEIWLVGTSYGTVTTSKIPTEYQSRYTGVIHTSTINYSKFIRSMSGVKYDEIKLPQLFIHHKDDNCGSAKYTGILGIASDYKIPLYTVSGDKKREDEKISSNPCDAFTPHGYKGIEAGVMKLIQSAIVNGIKSSDSYEFK